MGLGIFDSIPKKSRKCSAAKLTARQSLMSVYFIYFAKSEMFYYREELL
jgi:hypothetical protein